MTTRIRSRCAIVLLWLLPVPAPAVELLWFDTARNGTRYTVTFEAVIDGNRDRVFRLLTDYERWPRLNDAILDSRLLHSEGAVHPVVRSVSRACVVFFCRDIVHLQRITELGNAGLVACTIPEESDFRFGEVRWRIDPAGPRHSRISASARLEPDFWVPPLIGPWMIQHVLRRETLETLTSLEKFGRAG